MRQRNPKRVEEIVVGQCAYQVKIEPDEEGGGYVAEVPRLPGCITQGDTLEEVLEMAEDAIRAYLEAVAENPRAE
jgi:predicted RNase H-like HicB family nuclease